MRRSLPALLALLAPALATGAVTDADLKKLEAFLASHPADGQTSFYILESGAGPREPGTLHHYEGTSSKSLAFALDPGDVRDWDLLATVLEGRLRFLRFPGAALPGLEWGTSQVAAACRLLEPRGSLDFPTAAFLAAAREDAAVAMGKDETALAAAARLRLDPARGFPSGIRVPGGWKERSTAFRQEAQDAWASLLLAGQMEACLGSGYRCLATPRRVRISREGQDGERKEASGSGSASASRSAASTTASSSGLPAASVPPKAQAAETKDTGSKTAQGLAEACGRVREQVAAWRKVNPTGHVVLVLGAREEDRSGRWKKTGFLPVLLDREASTAQGFPFLQADFNRLDHLKILRTHLGEAFQEIRFDWSVGKFLAWAEAHVQAAAGLLAPGGTLYVPCVQFGLVGIGSGFHAQGRGGDGDLGTALQGLDLGYDSARLSPEGLLSVFPNACTLTPAAMLARRRLLDGSGGDAGFLEAMARILLEEKRFQGTRACLEARVGRTDVTLETPWFLGGKPGEWCWRSTRVKASS